MSSRKRLLTRGVGFGYAAITAQIIYSFASIPLALSHLSMAEFGMWGLVSTIVGYLMLAEMGLKNSFTRHLLECKDESEKEKYGRLFFGSCFALFLVGLLVCFLGILASQISWRWFPIPNELTTRFTHIMVGQSILMALSLMTQSMSLPLYVHHRQDIAQVGQIGLFAVLYVFLYYAFKAGWGIYAMLVSQTAGLAWSISYNYIACRALRFFPEIQHLKFPNGGEWNSIWKYSKGVFTVQIGGLLLASVPNILVARMLGLEAVATWTVATRIFSILRQVVNRPFDVALPMIYESFINGNMTCVTNRWKDITQLVMALSGIVFFVAAANNSTFVNLWTGGRITWQPSDNWLLAIYFYIFTAGGLCFGTIGIKKTIGKSRYVGFMQTLATIALAVPMTYAMGMTGLILSITIPYLPFMMYFGIRYLSTITAQGMNSLIRDALLRPTAATIPAALLAWACANMSFLLPGYFGLILSATSGFLCALAFVLALGVSPHVRIQMLSYLLKASGLMRLKNHQ